MRGRSSDPSSRFIAFAALVLVIAAGCSSQVTVSKPASYIAISHLFSSFIAASQFGRDSMLRKDIIDTIPETRFVSENETSLVVRKDNDVYYFGKEKKWTKLSESVLK